MRCVMGCVGALVSRLGPAVVDAVMLGLPFHRFHTFDACFMPLEVVKSSLLAIRAGFQLQNPMV